MNEGDKTDTRPGQGQVDPRLLQPRASGDCAARQANSKELINILVQKHIAKLQHLDTIAAMLPSNPTPQQDDALRWLFQQIQ